MKVLCVSDQIDPVVYSASIREHFGGAELVLAAGDLPMDYIDFIVSTLNRPLLFVFGNHNLEEFYQYSGDADAKNGAGPAASHPYGAGRLPDGHGAIYAGSRVVQAEGLIVAGLGGSMRYNQGDNQYTEFQMFWRMLKLIPALIFNRIFRGRFLDILLTHAPPEGIHDRGDRCHRGFRCFLWFMRTFRPRWLLHGHIHIYDQKTPRVTRYCGTTVINVYSRYVLDTEKSAAPDAAEAVHGAAM